jgi:RimJ/RimL family protein N-acetyltransferase
MWSVSAQTRASRKSIASQVTYTIPSSLRYPHGARVVSSHTEDGAKLIAGLKAGGMPADLPELGFVDATHLWAPWCVAVHNKTVVSIAFTARLSRVDAELGVVTPARFRGRSFAAAATAAWASLPALARRALFYSTNVQNASSRRVADRLRLRSWGRAFQSLDRPSDCA